MQKSPDDKISSPPVPTLKALDSINTDMDPSSSDLGNLSNLSSSSEDNLSKTDNRGRPAKSNVIGLIVADISNPFYAKISRAIEDKVNELGYHLLVCSSDEDPHREKKLVNFLVQSQQVRGLIISPTQNEKDFFNSVQKPECPYVFIDRYVEGVKCNTVTVDNFHGAFQAVTHLINRGFKRIGMLAITPTHLSTIHDRMRGYEEALKKNGFPVDKNFVKEISFHSVKASIKKALGELLLPNPLVDSLFILNNNLTVQALEELSEIGIRIPEDIGLISFDDVDLFKLTHPPISAVSQPMEKIGEEAVNLLFHPKEEQKHVVLPTELIIRKSCSKI